MKKTTTSEVSLDDIKQSFENTVNNLTNTTNIVSAEAVITEVLPQIDKLRSLGVSWEVIASKLSNDCKMNIPTATLRSLTYRVRKKVSAACISKGEATPEDIRKLQRKFGQVASRKFVAKMTYKEIVAIHFDKIHEMFQSGYTPRKVTQALNSFGVKLKMSTLEQYYKTELKTRNTKGEQS